MKIILYALFLLPVIALACGNPSPNKSGRVSSYSQSFKSYQTYEKDDTIELWHDHELKKVVKGLLAEGWFGKSFDNVKVTVTKGIVTIKGVAVNEQEKLDIENRINEIPEVRGVDNQLELKS